MYFILLLKRLHMQYILIIFLGNNCLISSVKRISITGGALALHCCKAHARINRKVGNSTLCKIVAPVNFSSKVCTCDYVGDGNYCANFGKIGSVRTSPQVGEI